MNSQENKPIEVFAGELWQASMIRDLLEDNNIQAYLLNEHMSCIAPWRIEAGGFNPAKVIVSTLDYDSAQKIVTDFNNQPSLPEEEQDSQV
jgi:hypothetical protein